MRHYGNWISLAVFWAALFLKVGLFCVAHPPSAELSFRQPLLSLDDTRTQLRIRKWILVYALFVYD